MSWKSRISFVLVCALGLFLCQILYAPNEAHAAAAFQAAGTAAEGTTGSVSPAWPTHQINDIALLFVEAAGGDTISLTTPNGFVAVPNSPQTTGSGTAGTKIAVYWARATSTSMAAPVLSSSADHIYAVILTYRGVTTGGTPFDITGGGVKGTASTSVSATGVTTTVPGALVVVGVTKDLDATTAFVSTWTNSNLTGITERFDAGTTQGLGGGIAVMDGTMATAGATGTTTVAVTSSINAFLTISLAPDFVIATCGRCHGYGVTFADGTARNNPDGTFPGSHHKHVSDYSQACSVCHAVPATETSADYAHRNGTILMASPINGNTGAAYTKGTSWAQTNSPSAFTGCTNTYCHSNGTSVISGSIPANTSTTWGGSTTCQSCHGVGGNDDGRPNYANNTPKRNTHGNGTNYGVTHKATACPTCHTGVSGSAGAYTISDTTTHNNGAYNLQSSIGYTQSTGVCATASCHGTATWGGPAMDCVSCHSVSLAKTKGGTGLTIRAISTEFGLAWGHKKSGRGAVTKFDCIVCHLEGNISDGSINSTYHNDANGYIDLRNPDGTGDARITNISGTAFNFRQFSMSFAAGSRTSTGHQSDTDIANVITQKFCLGCHDSNGATNTSARVSGGSATMPWGGSTGYSTANGAAAANGLIDVKTQFATTNSSAHPVLGPRNKDFPTAARYNDPYKPAGTRGTSGTLSQGVVMNCFDCHNTTAHLTDRTIAAHGGDVTIPGVLTITGSSPAAGTNQVTFCIECHIGYDSSTATHHNTGSALSGSTNNGMLNFLRYACNVCHSSGYNTAVVRPIRAMDVHGINVLPTGGLTKVNRWAGASTGSPAQVNAKPYAFIRNTEILTEHNPLKIGGSTYTPGCTMGNSTPNCSRAFQSFTGGGTY